MEVHNPHQITVMPREIVWNSTNLITYKELVQVGLTYRGAM